MFLFFTPFSVSPIIRMEVFDGNWGCIWIYPSDTHWWIRSRCLNVNLTPHYVMELPFIETLTVGKDVIVWPFMCCLQKNRSVFPFHTNFRQWIGTGGWNPSSWKRRALLSYIVNIKAFNDLAPEGVGTSAVIVLALVFQNIPASAPDVLTHQMETPYISETQTRLSPGPQILTVLGHLQAQMGRIHEVISVRITNDDFKVLSIIKYNAMWTISLSLESQQSSMIDDPYTRVLICHVHVSSAVSF